MRRRSPSFTNSRQFFRRAAESSHAAIELEMNGVLFNSNSSGGAFHQFDMAEFPDCRREIEADNLFFLAAPEACHQQNSSRNSFFAKRNGFVERRYAKPGCAFLFQRTGAFDGAVPVCVGLHHSTYGDSVADVLCYGAIVLAKRGKRDLGPCGTRGGAFRDFNGCHCSDYSAAKRTLQVTLGLLQHR